MFLVLYMGVSTPCRLIPWDKKNPGFHVVSNDPDAKLASIHFTKLEVYYLGSHEGCGCGFRGEYYSMDDPDEASAKNASHKQLHGYISECLTNQDFVELYACWSGEESEPADHYREVSLNDLGSESFFFKKREMTKVFK